MYKDGTGRTTVDILFSRKREVDSYPWLKGSDVIAKPANQTPLVAHAAVRLLHDAGIPPE